MTAEDERAAVVAYLREWAIECREALKDQPFDSRDWHDLTQIIDTLHTAADMIQTGDHITPGGE